jgi:hypothetical protein
MIMQTVLEHNKNEWNRFSQAAYQAGHSAVGDKFRAASIIKAGSLISSQQFNDLMSAYRNWLVFNKFD